MVVWTDSDWAGCHEARKSTNGGVIVWGGHCLKSWSSTQDTVALASGEAEYFAMVRGACQAIGMRELAADLGVAVGVTINAGSSAAKGISSRRGAGRARHIETN